MAYYTRTSPVMTLGGNLPPGTKWLLIANTAVFVLDVLLRSLGGVALFRPFELQPYAAVFNLFLWQFGAYMFLHGGIMHLAFNMLALWMFGATLEGTWGTRRFLQYYFACGIGAGICVVLANFLLPGGNPLSSTIGASGAIYGLLLAFGVLFPRQPILLFFFFPIEARFFVAIIGAIAFVSAVNAGAGGTVSHVAHLGGMVVGYIYLKQSLLRRRPGSAAYSHRYGAPKPVYRPSLMARIREWYKEWKLQRARRKFEVYMRKRQDREGRDRDRYVH